MKTILILLISACLISLSFNNSSCQTIIQDKPITTTVQGRVLNPLNTVETIKLIVNKVGFGQQELESSIDSTGHFIFKFELYKPTDLWLAYQTNFLLLIHPGDNLQIEFDGSKTERTEVFKTILISGKGDFINKQAVSFQNAYFERDSYSNWKKKEKAKKKLEPTQFKAFVDSIKTENDLFLNEFSKANQLNEETEIWARTFLENEYYTDLTFYPDSHRKALVLKKSEWDVPLLYYDYFKSYEPTTTSLASGNSVLDVTQKYLNRYIRLNAEIKLQELYKKDNTKNNLTDSIYIETIKTITTNKLLQEILITQYFNNLLVESDIESFEKNVNKIKSNVTATFLREPLFKTYETLKLTLQKSKTSPISNQDKFDVKSKNGVIQKIAKEHEGKPIYIDVWATWCSPCLEEFPYANKLQESLKDVTFIYLCIDSEKDRFQNTVNRFELHGNHYFLNSTESKLLRKEFKIDGIPHYILVDKNGIIIYEGNTLRPSEDNTRIEMQKLLK